MNRQSGVRTQESAIRHSETSPEPPAPPPPPLRMPHPHLQKFVDLEKALPKLWRTRAGPTVKFDAYNLGDEGLATVLASRNLRFVVRPLL